MLNDTTQLDAIKNEAEKSSTSLEEVRANAGSDSTREPKQNDVKADTSVQESVQAILNKARKDETNDSSKPEGDDPPDDEVTEEDKGKEDSSNSQDSSSENKADEEKETSSDEAKDPDTDQENAGKQTDDDKEAAAEKLANETEDEKKLREARELIAAADVKAGKTIVPDEKLPFHKHPRFQQLITENRSMKAANAELDSIHKYRKENNVDDDTFNQALTLAALAKKDPKSFAGKLREIAEMTEVEIGVRLPSDLAKKVEDGVLGEAEAKELSQLRLSKQQNERQQQSAKQMQEQQRVNSITNGLNAVGMDIMKKDPTFRPKTNGSPDGIYEFSLKSFTLLQAQKPAQTSLEASQQFMQCYNEVKALIQSSMPRSRASRNFVAASQRNSRASGLTPSSRQNGENGNGSDTVTDAVNAALKSRGIRIRPSSERNGD